MKKRIQTIDNKTLVAGAAGEVLKNEMLVEESATHRVTLKAFVNGTLTTVSDGKYEEKTVDGVAKTVTPSSGYNAMSKVVITSPNNFTTLAAGANRFYKLTAGDEGGTHTFNGITGSSYILVCKEPSTGICTMFIQAVTSGSVATTLAASEVAYVALYSSETPSGTEAGVTKSESTKVEFETKANLFLAAA